MPTIIRRNREFDLNKDNSIQDLTGIHFYLDQFNTRLVVNNGSFNIIFQDRFFRYVHILKHSCFNIASEALYQNPFSRTSTEKNIQALNNISLTAHCFYLSAMQIERGRERPARSDNIFF